MRPGVEDLAPARQALGHFEETNRVSRGTLDNGGRIYPHGNGDTAWIVEGFPLWRMMWPAYGGRISPWDVHDEGYGGGYPSRNGKAQSLSRSARQIRSSV